ncbi:MAG: hypothetical protein H0W62_04830 [Chitinophagales bacterium]|nr:hypothetical protein [Chitinophagales bacterium]
MQKIYFCWILLFIVAMSSCKKKTFTPELNISDRNYFPLWVGKYIIYDVDSIVYSSFFSRTDSFHYQIQELIDTAFTDGSANTVYRIVRSKRNDETSAWNVTDIWSASLTANSAEKVEENLRFIKLVFPIFLNESWKGNSKILIDSSTDYLSDWNYEYTSVNVTSAINSFTFDSTVTVLQHDDENAIQKIFYEEKYAKGVGLIYKEAAHIETQPGSYPDGTVYRMSIKEFN